MTASIFRLPKVFIWERLHSLTGLWLVLFLIIHLLANSQAALLLGSDGLGFINSANALESLPYLPVIEIVLLAIPFAIHAYWGVLFIMKAKYNSLSTDGSKPALPEYPRNHAYSWQRITSWLLLVLITFHVIHMRYLENPTEGQIGDKKYFIVRLTHDTGLRSLAERLGAKLYTPEEIQKLASLPGKPPSHDPLEQQRSEQHRSWIEALSARPLHPDTVIAEANNFGTAELLMVRDTFKRPEMLLLYTVLVLASCFHAFNGLWTCMITWGVTISPKSQNHMRRVAWALMYLVAFLGLASVWGTYWLNLRH